MFFWFEINPLFVINIDYFCNPKLIFLFDDCKRKRHYKEDNKE
jgi:hypothetical protein